MLLAMNDISETSLQLTFIIQITIIGRAVSIKIKLRSIVVFTYVAEGFILVGWLNVLVCILDAAGMISGEAFHVFGNVLESVSLVFVLVFRFFYLSLSSGLRNVLAKRKMELLMYMLLVVHELPFAILEQRTGVSWEFPQGILNRLLVVTCILLNLQHKARENSRSSVTVKSKRDSSVAASRGRVSAGFKPFTRKLSSRREAPTFPDITKVAVSGGISYRVVVSTTEQSIREKA
ncbi:hypothetical protein PF005_g17242 [Phytophthora fragariae]|uniref:Uncharacterized protein n=1 Tax=Phytophthora fragariae TaxID=53985 RepID=A0A6A3JRD8_9STRA|nr:hypothetical protein PF003_g12747 [Phytophthora fragariae]KAE8931393.1 hypothetical protein PF009_g18553 [Phytophthora fragariae]KAE8995045.1 hypothetical protein PF011_g16502 [Phytophthora fragariae]KAE9095347.1 hypothetical protein PF010_g16740 [Phytophthora fragariae]KAE9095424.1 hypothetical protein PF007_g17389 [Phytophthora fragariae]